MISTKEALDELFSSVKFDVRLYKKIMHKNIAFITKNDDHKNFFGGQLIGCYPIKYTLTDQESFFSDLYDIDFVDVNNVTREITTINQSFKISSDPINLVIMYTVYRFLNNKTLSSVDRMKYALSILDYFSYRTIAVIISNYFIYPISESEAISLFEKLSNKYIIKQQKNWIEYCQYRSKEFIGGKFKNVLEKLNDDNMLSAAINDLFTRTKDTMKNVYREFIDMNNSKSSIGSRKTSITDIDGKDVLADRTNTPDNYYNYLISTLMDKHSFIKEEVVDSCVSIVKTVDYDDFKKFLLELVEYVHSKRDHYKEVTEYMHEVIVTSIDYMMDNQYLIGENHNLVFIMERVSASILFARGTSLVVNEVKERGDVVVSHITGLHTKHKKIYNLRNAFYIYIMLRALTKKYYS